MKYLHIIEVGKEFLNKMLKSLTIKEKINWLDSIKIKNPSLPKDIIKRLEKQEWGKYLLFIHLEKLSHLEYIKNCKSIKTNQINSSIAKWTRFKLTLDDVVKVINIWNVFKELTWNRDMQIETIITTTIHPKKWLKLKR